MTQFPPPPDAAGAVVQPSPPARSSGWAIASLVCSLVACIPVLPLLGAVFGVVALRGMSRSRGARGGRGLAIAGIIIGILAVAGQAVIGGALYWAAQLPPRAAMAFLTDVAAGDATAARARLTGAASRAVSDDELAAFRDRLRADFGAIEKVSMDFSGHAIQSTNPTANGRGQSFGTQSSGAVPLRFDFDGKTAFGRVAIEPDTAGRLDPPLQIHSITILTDDGALTLPSGHTPGDTAAPEPGEATPEPGNAAQEPGNAGQEPNAADDAGDTQPG